jgi:hypothetical protein
MALRKPWNRGGIRSWLLTLGMLAALAGHSSVRALLCGTALLLASMPIQFWSKGCLHQDREVTRSGPYRFVRHPFYLGNFILDAGLVVMSGCWLLAVLFPFWWFLVYVPVMREEEDTLIRLFGAEYQAYKARVPMLLPVRRPLARSQRGGFDWKSRNIVYTEIPRALKYFSYPLMYVVAWRVFEYYSHAITQPAVTDLLLLVAGIGGIMAVRAIWMHRFPRAQGRM